MTDDEKSYQEIRRIMAMQNMKASYAMLPPVVSRIVSEAERAAEATAHITCTGLAQLCELLTRQPELFRTMAPWLDDIIDAADALDRIRTTLLSTPYNSRIL